MSSFSKPSQRALQTGPASASRATERVGVSRTSAQAHSRSSPRVPLVHLGPLKAQWGALVDASTNQGFTPGHEFFSDFFNSNSLQLRSTIAKLGAHLCNTYVLDRGTGVEVLQTPQSHGSGICSPSRRVSRERPSLRSVFHSVNIHDINEILVLAHPSLRECRFWLALSRKAR